jgi:hypothetical protein
MPFDHLREQEMQSEVLSQVEGFSGIPALAEKFVPVDRVRELYRRVQQSPEGFGLENLLAEMRVDLRVDAADAARIPATGQVVVVANHPFGMLDGAVLAVLLTRVRPDVKVMTNYLLSDVPELARHCIFVNPFQTDPLQSDRALSDEGSAGLAAERRNAGHFSRGRSLAVAISSGRNCGPALERYRGAFDTAHRSGCAAGLFLR